MLDRAPTDTARCWRISVASPMPSAPRHGEADPAIRGKIGARSSLSRASMARVRSVIGAVARTRADLAPVHLRLALDRSMGSTIASGSCWMPRRSRPVRWRRYAPRGPRSRRRGRHALDADADRPSSEKIEGQQGHDQSQGVAGRPACGRLRRVSGRACDADFSSPPDGVEHVAGTANRLISGPPFASIELPAQAADLRLVFVLSKGSSLFLVSGTASGPRAKPLGRRLLDEANDRSTGRSRDRQRARGRDGCAAPVR